MFGRRFSTTNGNGNNNNGNGNGNGNGSNSSYDNPAFVRSSASGGSASIVTAGLRDSIRYADGSEMDSIPAYVYGSNDPPGQLPSLARMDTVVTENDELDDDSFRYVLSIPRVRRNRNLRICCGAHQHVR